MLVHLAIMITALSLLAFGGANAIIPELHRQVVDAMGAISDSEFTNLFALAQTASGPNVMISASSVGGLPVQRDLRSPLRLP